MKIGKILRYIRTSKTMSVILSTYKIIMGQLINIGLLFFLFIFIFGILGQNLFYSVEVRPYTDGVHPSMIYDFSTFVGSILLLI